MSNRERWIVYPLLFLALLSSIADKLVPEGMVRFTSVECGQLSLVTSRGARVLTMRSDPHNAGEFVLYDAAEQPLFRVGMDEHQRGTEVEGWSKDQRSRFRLQAHNGGSFGEWRRGIGESVAVGFSADSSQAGLWGLDLHQQPVPAATPVDATTAAPDPPSLWGVAWPAGLAGPSQPIDPGK